MKLFFAALACTCAFAAPAADEVKSLPGFPADFPFKAYSGFLDVTFSPTINGYDGARIHYQFHTSQSNSSTSDPIVAWHTGGPGGSSIYGQYAELGYFQVSSSGERVNPDAWNNVANMLYLESPAGSFITPVDQRSGFSYCTKNGEKQQKCSWNDQTQAEAYGHTLQAFFKAFPEYSSNELYLAGESYAGQYVPNIAAHLLETQPSGVPALKGIAVGNGCWGGDANSVNCNGPNDDKNLVNLYHGKGLVSDKLYASIQSACGDFSKESLACEAQLLKMDKAVGPHNVYNVYDNCPNLDSGKKSLREWFELTGKSPRWLRKFLVANMQNPNAYAELEAMAAGAAEVRVGAGAGVGDVPAAGGGYDWTCGQFDALPVYFARADVRAALNLPNAKENGSVFDYDSSGPASVTLYPKLIKQIRVLIYNGDADSCVPYLGNEEWTASMVDQGVVTEAQAWHPWYQSEEASAPAGYATSYSDDFQFLTIRLSGHQVPKNNGAAALAMFKGFLAGKTF